MKVGDYVRTKNGNIRKIEEVINKEYNEPDYGVDKIVINIEEVEDTIYMEPFLYKEDIIKSSPNIIDLIEVGDILVIKDFVDEACMIFTDIYLIQNEEQLLHIKNDLEKNKNKMLYSIVTKEQFKNMEYEVK